MVTPCPKTERHVFMFSSYQYKKVIGWSLSEAGGQRRLSGANSPGSPGTEQSQWGGEVRGEDDCTDTGVGGRHS